MIRHLWLFLALPALLIVNMARSQKNKKQPGKEPIPVVIKNGIMQWSQDGKEVALFGINYTAAFAYAYRAIGKTGITHEEAIRQDVYHFARLGLDAFRVHVWDTEISDSAGNLLNNDHLRLFDFLVAELKKYRIKTIITPIAFWGNGYPEPDENTPGFSRHFGKGKATINDTAIRAQENFLAQFFTHINPFTGLSYQQDPDIIATEINNEPNHSGTQQGVTKYINRLYEAIRNSGWKKPIFYNISENPAYASATVASKADGYSFQWYPSGLVGGKTLQSNYLPHVDTYRIPFGDSLPLFNQKPRMVYEFDPADILNPIMYPAMARSFRVAGFQWATQFAYDPMAIAHANTEYQTHYLNLAYTPGKAISMLIAGEVFRSTKRMEKIESYPSDSVFGPFRISFRQSLSEMNSGEKFYYSNHTSSKPVNVFTLKQLAGTGSSPIVQYEGTGAYFLDRLDEGVWRLEVMPDAILLGDPYEKTSPSKVVSAIRWNTQNMQVQLPSLGQDFSIKGLNKGNNTSLIATRESFNIGPGTYLLIAKDKNPAIYANKAPNHLPLDGFVAPGNTQNEPLIHSAAPYCIPAGKPFNLQASGIIPPGSKPTLLLSKPGWARPMEVTMTENRPGNFSGTIPAEMARPGILQYRILVQNGPVFTTFPGAVSGNPMSWDYIAGESWETIVTPLNSDLTLFNANTDRNPTIFPSWGRGIQQGIVPAQWGGGFAFHFQGNHWGAESLAAMQMNIQNKLHPFENEVDGYAQMVIRGKKLVSETQKFSIILVTKDAMAWSAIAELTPQTSEIILPLGSFKPGRYLLLPRPYPAFHPLWFTGTGNGGTFRLQDIDLLQLVFKKEDNPGLQDSGPGFEIEWIGLRK